MNRKEVSIALQIGFSCYLEGIKRGKSINQPGVAFVLYLNHQNHRYTIMPTIGSDSSH